MLNFLNYRGLLKINIDNSTRPCYDLCALTATKFKRTVKRVNMAKRKKDDTEITQASEDKAQKLAVSPAEGKTEEITEAFAEEIVEEAAAADTAAAEMPAPLPPEIQNDINTEETVAVKPRGDKVLTKKQKRVRTALSWGLITVGVILMSFSVYFFQIPNNFTLGGVAGISIMLSSVVPLSQSVIMAIINVFLLIVGLIILGKQCTIKTIYCSLLYTGIIWLFEFTDVLGHITGIPSNGATPVPLTDQPFLEMAYSILLFGAGGALVFNCGATSGGTDIIALILKKYTRINVGMALTIIDLIVVCISIVTIKSTTIALYSFMGLFARSFLLDGIIESIGKTKYITIITTNPDPIGDYILNVINHGYTKYNAQGGYTGEAKTVLVSVCKRGEALKLKTKVKEFDNEAFVIITDANEILGKGFGGTL